jgi:hypothetical protein
MLSYDSNVSIDSMDRRIMPENRLKSRSLCRSFCIMGRIRHKKISRAPGIPKARA